MIAVDTNILIYAHRAESPRHKVASSSIKQLAEGTEPWCIPWPCLHEFLSIVTHPRVFKPPTPMAAAFRQVDEWTTSASLVLASESAQHMTILRAMILGTGMVGPRVHDARIAAIAQQHGVTELWTADRDFSAFSGLKIRNPLVSTR